MWVQYSDPYAAKSSFALWNTMDYFNNIFYLYLVEFIDVDPTKIDSQLYTLPTLEMVQIFDGQHN